MEKKNDNKNKINFAHLNLDQPRLQKIVTVIHYTIKLRLRLGHFDVSLRFPILK